MSNFNQDLFKNPIHLNYYIELTNLRKKIEEFQKKYNKSSEQKIESKNIILN